ncbi:MAG: ABC transporter ATP-binding protein [Chlorobium sp.]|nr:ABC transporter ATP-binding protein [Chlorobium phaeovibrioides]NQU45818.1 ABC transporter ATP-binding protein [Chlorobium sp.]
MGAAVQTRNITRKFGSFTAARNVSLTIEEGTVHAIVGENGAGKSTLTNIISGMLSPTGGELIIREKPVRFTSPRDASEEGIGMVHQHFMLAGELTVAENIMLGYEECGLFSPLNRKAINSRIRECGEEYSLALNPEAKVSSLSVGEAQRVEIMKLLLRNASIMILDEPTAVLTPMESTKLFTTLRTLAEKGHTILFISHKLDEVLSFADSISVMRKGEIVSTMPAAGATKEQLAGLMVEGRVRLRAENPPATPGGERLLINNLSFVDRRGVQKLRGLSFWLRAGEIYGIAGVEGNAQSELLQALSGMLQGQKGISGSIQLEGRSLLELSPRQITDSGVGAVPENRHTEAVITSFSVSENLIFGRHREHALHRGAGFNHEALRQLESRLIPDYGVLCQNPQKQQLEALSGGNQQKVVVAREMTRPNLKLLILAHPTRGIDIGAIETIHRKIIEARSRGVAILLISAELEEIITLSTRIGCLYNGAISREFTQEECDMKRLDGPEFQKEIGLYIT